MFDGIVYQVINGLGNIKTCSGDNPGKAEGIVGSRRPARLCVQNAITKFELSVVILQDKRNCSSFSFLLVA